MVVTGLANRPFRKVLSTLTGIDEEKLPSSYQLVGDIMLIKLRDEVYDMRYRIGEAIVSHYKHVRTVCLLKGIRDLLRVPDVEVIAGDPRTETVHRENGIRYSIDVSRLMFSKGNQHERARVSRVAGKGETVVDMFCGVGQFSLPLAKFNPSCRVYAIDASTYAIRYLRRNVIINGVKNVIPINSDCRTMAKYLESVADRVIMGYLPSPEGYLDCCMSFLKDRGFVHYHYVSTSKDPLDGVRSIERAAGRRGYELHRVTYWRVVKSYAPRLWHVAIDVELRAS